MWRSGYKRGALAAGLVLFMVSLVGAVSTAPVSAAGETVVSTPSTGLVDAATVSVDVTTTSVTSATVFIAVTQCGNATSSGTPLASTTAGDCTGAEGFGTTLQLIGFPAGAVASGGHNLPAFKLNKSNIGSNHAKCIPLASATIPCVIRAATATTGGVYTGPGYNFSATADISYAAVPDTTTTTAAPTTTTPPTTAGPTTTSPGGTTTTKAPGTTTTTKVPATTTVVVSGGGTTGGTPDSGLTITLAGRTLALTGPNAATWWLLGLGLALLDLGYLALSSTWTKKVRGS